MKTRPTTKSTEPWKPARFEADDRIRRAQLDKGDSLWWVVGGVVFCIMLGVVAAVVFP